MNAEHENADENQLPSIDNQIADEQNAVNRLEERNENIRGRMALIDKDQDDLREVWSHSIFSISSCRFHHRCDYIQSEEWIGNFG